MRLIFLTLFMGLLFAGLFKMIESSSEQVTRACEDLKNNITIISGEDEICITFPEGVLNE